MLTIRLPQDIEARLSILAEATKRPKSFYVREALERSLEDIEDTYLADSAYERFVASSAKTTSLEKVMEKYGLED